MSARGVTLMEIMLVLALGALAAACALSLDIRSYRANALQSERGLVLALLRRARALSLHGVCTADCRGAHAHGVHFDATARVYTVFEGDRYAARYAAADAVFPASPEIGRSGANDVTFSALSATSSAAFLTLKDAAGRAEAIDIGADGQIMEDD